MISRAELIDHFKRLDPRIDGNNPECPLWIPDNGTPSVWFVCVNPIGIDRFKSAYYDWCNLTLKGRVRCYSSGDDEEWWGFTEKEDIPVWILKWT